MPAPHPTLTLDEVAAHCRHHDVAPHCEGTTVGVELEFLTLGPDGDRVSLEAAEDLVQRLSPLPAGGRLTIEPGGQLEISTEPFGSPDAALAAAATDLFHVDTACGGEGIELVALGADPLRPPERVVTAPRYRAMESYFDALGPAGRTMMCNTAALQVNLCVGPPDQQRRRWRLAHLLGPSLIAAFANSPFAAGGPTGWQSSRLRTWWLLDPTRSAPVSPDGDPADAWVDYALAARVMLIRSGEDYHPVADGLSFGQWLAEGHELGHPTIDDLTYHLTTLFPPVRPKGWLELRMFDALPTPFWHVASAVTVSLLEAEDLADDIERAVGPTAGMWTDAAQLGLAHPGLAASAVRCFELALEALDAAPGSDGTVEAVAGYLDRWVARGRCPADDRLDDWRRDGRLWPARESPVPYADQLRLARTLP